MADLGMLNIAFDHNEIGKNTADYANKAIGIMLVVNDDDKTVSNYLIGFIAQEKTKEKDTTTVVKKVLKV